MTASPAPANILEAISSPDWWGPWFRDPDSWKPWRAFLAAVFALPLSEDQLELFRACTGRSAGPSATRSSSAPGIRAPIC